MKKSFWVVGGVGIALIAAYALIGPLRQGQAQTAPPGQARGIAPRVSVVTAAASTRDMPITQRAVGWVEPVATVVIKPRIDGVITEQAVHDGQMVQAGDLLFRLDDRSIKAAIAKDEAQILRDEALRNQAGNDATRAKSLLERSVATKQLADQTEANAKATAAAVLADRAQRDADQVQLTYTYIRAPIAGRVGIVNTSVGNFVRTSDSGGLLSIVQVTPLRVSFNVPERELDAFREALARPEGTAVKVFVAGDKVERATGKLTFIDNTVDNITGTFTAKAEVPNGNGALWPGQYITAFVELGMRKNVTVVPLVAVQEGPNGPYVFLVGPGDKIEMRKVAVIETRGQQAAIASGVAPGDRMVIEGQGALRDGSFVREGAPAAQAHAAAPSQTTTTP
jgi:multidrug efflux system membrane fusion protein